MSCPIANQVSTLVPSLKPSPTVSSPRPPRAAILSCPHKARHSLYPPSRTLHLQQQYGPSPQNFPPPKTPVWVNPRLSQLAPFTPCTLSGLVQGSPSSLACKELSTGPRTAPMDLWVVRIANYDFLFFFFLKCSVMRWQISVFMLLPVPGYWTCPFTLFFVGIYRLI